MNKHYINNFSIIITALICTFIFENLSFAQKYWYRGTTHAHTSHSDGSLDPQAVVDAYKLAGYDFIFITDENNITPTDTLSDSTFICFNGEEALLTQHISCLNIRRPVEPGTLLQVLDSTNIQGGITILNHPLRVNHISYAREIIKYDSLKYLEIFNGKNEKDGYNDTQMLWDSILTAGKLIYGVAVDDFHEMKHICKGWIMVSASSLQKDSIVNAIKKGNFYCSTGVFITELTVTDSLIRIVTENATKIVFTGNNRRMLQTSLSDTASYTIRRDEGYIRITTLNNEGKMAWTQPLFWNKKFEGIPEKLKNTSDNSTKWIVIPNSRSGEIIIKSECLRKEINYTVFEPTGKSITSGKVYNTTQIILNIKESTTGIYLVRLITENYSSTLKVFMQ